MRSLATIQTLFFGTLMATSSCVFSRTQTPTPSAGSTPQTFNPSSQQGTDSSKNAGVVRGCSYMPLPPYTKEAKAAKFQGTILAQGIIKLNGSITDIKILKSPGLGLDESVIKTMKKWKCSPAIGPNGKPVPTQVPFEITFRLN